MVLISIDRFQPLTCGTPTCDGIPTLEERDHGCHPQQQLPRTRSVTSDDLLPARAHVTISSIDQVIHHIHLSAGTGLPQTVSTIKNWTQLCVSKPMFVPCRGPLRSTIHRKQMETVPISAVSLDHLRAASQVEGLPHKQVFLLRFPTKLYTH